MNGFLLAVGSCFFATNGKRPALSKFELKAISACVRDRQLCLQHEMQAKRVFSGDVVAQPWQGCVASQSAFLRVSAALAGLRHGYRMQHLHRGEKADSIAAKLLILVGGSMLRAGLEPARPLGPEDFKSSVSTYSTTPACSD